MSNFQDWKIKNPNKTINDFYAEFPPINTNAQQSFHHLNENNTRFRQTETIYVQQVVHEEHTDSINILISAIALIAVFLPWINAKFLSLSILKLNGLDLHQLIQFSNAFHGGNPNTFIINSFYFIPGGALLALIGGLIKKDLITILGQIVYICSVGFWCYIIWNTTNGGHTLEDSLGIGFYLSCLSGFVFIIKLLID